MAVRGVGDDGLAFGGSPARWRQSHAAPLQEAPGVLAVVSAAVEAFSCCITSQTTRPHCHMTPLPTPLTLKCLSLSMSWIVGRRVRPHASPGLLRKAKFTTSCSGWLVAPVAHTVPYQRRVARHTLLLRQGRCVRASTFMAPLSTQ